MTDNRNICIGENFLQPRELTKVNCSPLAPVTENGWVQVLWSRIRTFFLIDDGLNSCIYTEHYSHSSMDYLWTEKDNRIQEPLDHMDTKATFQNVDWLRVDKIEHKEFRLKDNLDNSFVNY